MSLNIAREPGMKPGGLNRAGKATSRRRPWLRNRANMGMLCAVMAPVLVGFGAVAVDYSNKAYRTLLLRQTVQSAALAAGNSLPSYFSSGAATTLIAAATGFAGLNMPATTYGTVVSTATVGTWSGSTFTSGGTTPNAVKVTGTTTLPLYFGTFYGTPSVTLTSTAVSSYYQGYTYDTIVINDLSKSFKGEISQQQTVDNAILNCVGSGGTSSQFGLTAITGHANVLQPLNQASSLLTGLLTFITGLESCGGLLAPPCSGSNVAAGIYSAVQQFKGVSSSIRKNIVIITDGAPNASGSTSYSATDGVTCTTHCTDAELEAGAQTQAAAAKAAGINITTIYYSGDDTNPTDQAAYKSFLASLVTGSGKALIAPTTTALSAAFGGCPSMPSVLKTVM